MSEIPTVTIPLTEIVSLRQDSFELEQLRRLIYQGFFASASTSSHADIDDIFHRKQTLWRDLIDSYYDSLTTEEEKEQ